MSCLDINLCPGEKLYNVTCNFSTMYIDYECNSSTCMRVDGTYDCCAIHPYYCRQPLESLFRTPTIEPSRAINTKMCNKICGGAHYKMKMIVVVKDKASYKKWMAQKNKETFKMKYFPAAEETATPKDSLINKPLI